MFSSKGTSIYMYMHNALKYLAKIIIMIFKFVFKEIHQTKSKSMKIHENP